IVTYDGRPAVTYFFSSSGGYTESIQDAWPGSAPEPWLQAVPDPYDGAGDNPYHRWGRQMSLAAAGRRLRGLVRGSLIGVSAVHDGRSPRIVSAEVVGTGGNVTVTGAQLQGVFGLDSTLATFTTISTQDPGGTLSGTIFPAPAAAAAATVSVQRATVGWHTIAALALSTSGAYGTTVAPGRYRIVFGGLRGPAVTVP
ncbi:MAG: hypothetical protein ACRDMX_01740, partial [Solirubrobacteraceae bacterium]